MSFGIEVRDGEEQVPEETVSDISLGSEDFEDDAEPQQVVEEPDGPDEGLDSAEGFEDEEETPVQERKKHTFPEQVFKAANPTANTDLALAIPTISVDEVLSLLETAKEISKSLTRDQAKSISAHAESVALTCGDDVYDRFFQQADELSNRIKTRSGIVIGQTIPPYKEPVQGKILDANEASAYLARLNKTFDHVYLPAIHSGMWLKVQAPTMTDLHNLTGAMASSRNQLGYDTRGATLSCDTALRNMVFMDWLMERTVGTNMKESDAASIRRNLVATDIPLLAQQLAATIHPSGYLTERACSSKPGVCTHVEKATLRLSKMIFTDLSRLTEKQLTHMQTLLRTASRKTEEDMAAYRAEFGKTTVRQVTLSPFIKVTFAAPSVEAYANTAEEWASEIKKSSEDIISSMTEMEARQHLQEQARLGILTKYSAWVETIDLQGRVVQDRIAIARTLATMSEDDEIVKRFTDGVSQYISDCTVAAVGVPDYECPACKGQQSQGASGITAAVAAIDPITAFFTLTQLKIQRTLLRDSVL